MNYDQNKKHIYYVPKVKTMNEDEWKHVDVNGCIYGDAGTTLMDPMRFKTKDEAISWLNKTLNSSHDYAKFISGMTDDVSRNVIYGYVEYNHKRSSVFMHFMNSKLNDRHDALVAKRYETPNITCRITEEVIL